MIRRITTILAICFIGYTTSAQPYKDPTLPITERVRDLLSRMTTEEKVAQLRSTWSAHPRINDKLLADPQKMDSLFGQGIGMINPDFDNTLEQSLRFRAAISDYIRSRTRLAIPPLFLDESHHGLLAMQTDVFPMSIGLACSWDTLLVQKVYTYIAAQASARGTAMVLAPVIDVTRDPRWGRTGETFGEDPFLCGLMGSAVVRGFQGSNDGSIAPGHVAATLKHFTGHGQPEAGVNQGPADYPERVLRTFHMEPFRLAVDRVKPAGIMPAYLEIDGIPCHANPWLLKDVLRKEWGYTGVLVSDWWAIDQLYQKHHITPDRKTAAKMAFDAGVTVDLPMGANYALLTALAKEGAIDPTALDEAVSLVLTLKFKSGLFDRPADYSLAKAQTRIDLPEGRALALQAAEASMVLLKNDKNILPLSKTQYHRIAVIGPCAATNYTGDYSGVPVRNVSLLQGIRNELGKTADIVYAKGVDLSGNGDTLSLNNFQYIDSLVVPDPEVNRRKIDSAAALAGTADLIICAVGTNEQFVREAEEPHHYGDISTLDLPSQQDELVKALVATGKPVVVYLAHGRPQSINYIATHASAILDGWYTGEESGNAAAHILFGDVNPSGKLTISIPRSVGQIPVYYNHKPSAQFLPYVTESNTPLYPFGYGLSYTTYTYSAPRLSATTMSPDGSVTVGVDVTNTGRTTGDEIVQLYVHQQTSSVTRPVKELKNFSRIHLEPGETKTVSFIIDKNSLALWDRNLRYTVEKSLFQIMVGPNSTNLQTVDLTVKDTIPGTFGHDLHFLQQHDSVIVLESGDSKVIVSPKYQGKVFTSTNAGNTGASFGWIHYKAFDGPADPHMNAYGGENRLWLGPEGGRFSLFFPPGAKMEFTNWKTPAAFDTEPWEVTNREMDAVTLKKKTRLTNYAGTKLNLAITRRIAIYNRKDIDSILSLTNDDLVKAVGYQTVNTLTNTGDRPWTETTGMPCLWLLDMFNPSPATVIVIPYAGETTKPATTDYFGEIPADRIMLDRNILFFKADGKSRGKLGIHPARSKPVAGSYDVQHRVLTITLFDANTTARYLNQEWNTTKPPFSGDAVNAYNDGPLADGSQMGPFYELESVSPAAFLKAGQSQVHHHSVFHFTGPETALDAISQKTLGVSIDKIKAVF